MSKPTKNFQECALSHFGSDGGNPQSTVWTCGLEWGGGYENDEIMPSHLEVHMSPAWEREDIPTKLFGIKHQYNQKLAWLFSFLYGWDIDKYKDEAVRYGLFCSDGVGYKMNAYPLSFANRRELKWTETTSATTGFLSFNDYLEWCINFRGAFYDDFVKQHSPKIIVATGIGDEHLNGFLKFFKGDNSRLVSGDMLQWLSINSDNTILVITPFFGQGGIMSYQSMQKLGHEIKDIASIHFRSEVI